MKEIVRNLGFGLLDIIGGAGVIMIFYSFMRQNGIIYEYVSAFMKSICG